MEKERSFSEILTEFLELNNLTLTEFGKRIDKKSGHISDWMREKSAPSYYSLKAIIKTFNEPANFWLGLEDEF